MTIRDSDNIPRQQLDVYLMLELPKYTGITHFEYIFNLCFSQLGGMNII